MQGQGKFLLDKGILFIAGGFKEVRQSMLTIAKLAKFPFLR